jgi:small conductance mechanosensitive channel
VAQTAADPAVPASELELLLRPLPRAQLLVEADAWQALLQDKAREIAGLEIALQREQQAWDAQQAAAREQAGPDQSQHAEPSAGDSEVDKAREAAREAERRRQLEHLAALREERSALVDRLRTVLDALEGKTDEGDSDTRSKISDHRLYAKAVGGIKVNVDDSTSAWIAVKGWLMSEEGGLRWAKNLGRFLVTLLVAWIIARLVSGAIRHALNRVRGTSRLLEDFLVKAARWIVLAIGLIMALAALEVSIGPLLAVVGAAGFVVAFALQDSLSNFASGLMILFFRPFDQGDVVDAGGVSGKVESMNLVSTTILTFDNKRMVVPNNKVWNDVITNATGVTQRRVDMEFGIGYDDDIDKAQAILESVIGRHPKVLKEPEPLIRVNALADSSVNFIVRPWAATADYWDVYWDVTREVKQRFDAEGIGIPFPQRDVHLYLAGAREEAVSRLAGGLAAERPARPAPARTGRTVSSDGGLDDGDGEDD